MKEPALDVGGFKFTNAPIRWELVPTPPKVTTCLKLLRKFRPEWRWFQKPIAFARNPEKNGVPLFSTHSDVIICVYPKGYYIKIERYGNEIFGPHPCILYYRSDQAKGEIAWLAICQIEAMWHSDERMLIALNRAIKNKELWQSETTAQTIVIK